MSEVGRFMIIAGLVVVALGIIVTFAGKIPFLGRLPGDIYVKKRAFTFYFPLATCLLLSIIITIILNLFLRR
ncbi:MAG TPA: DUF2905 domain-containing protein [Candidatus Latescibacteria bacterium]|nr:DUF2905 domain-containing protein [Candidatus Latescibacterota bacterium]